MHGRDVGCWQFHFPHTGPRGEIQVKSSAASSPRDVGDSQPCDQPIAADHSATAMPTRTGTRCHHRAGPAPTVTIRFGPWVDANSAPRLAILLDSTDRPSDDTCHGSSCLVTFSLAFLSRHAAASSSAIHRQHTSNRGRSAPTVASQEDESSPGTEALPHHAGHLPGGLLRVRERRQPERRARHQHVADAQPPGDRRTLEGGRQRRRIRVATRRRHLRLPTRPGRRADESDQPEDQDRQATDRARGRLGARPSATRTHRGHTGRTMLDRVSRRTSAEWMRAGLHVTNADGLALSPVLSCSSALLLPATLLSLQRRQRRHLGRRQPHPRSGPSGASLRSRDARRLAAESHGCRPDDTRAGRRHQAYSTAEGTTRTTHDAMRHDSGGDE